MCITAEVFFFFLPPRHFIESILFLAVQFIILYGILLEVNFGSSVSG